MFFPTVGDRVRITEVRVGSRDVLGMVGDLVTSEVPHPEGPYVVRTPVFDVYATGIEHAPDPDPVPA